MDVFSLTRTLIDIESITGNELAVGDWLHDYLQPLVTEYGGTLEKIEVEPKRNNILAIFGEPVVTLSTHLDTVPPFFASREDDEFIWGRGACDVKGIIASMIFAAKALLAEGLARVCAAVCGGRGAELGWRVFHGQPAARVAVSDQWRADVLQAGAGFEGRAAV